MSYTERRLDTAARRILPVVRTLIRWLNSQGGVTRSGVQSIVRELRAAADELEKLV
jgi:hypothetical protein